MFAMSGWTPSPPSLSLFSEGTSMNSTAIITTTNPEIVELVKVLTVLRMICMNILVPTICLIGLIANVLNIIVLTRPAMASSTSVYLTAVALCDMVNLCGTCVYCLWRKFDYIGWLMRCVPFVVASANLGSNTTTWLIVTFTVERYIAICHPMLRQKICTAKRAKWITCGVAVVCLMVTLPDYFQLEAARLDNTTRPHYELHNTQAAVQLSQIGYHYVNQIVFVFCPFVLLLIFNTLLVRTVIQTNKERARMLQASTSSASATKGGASAGESTAAQRTEAEQQRITIMLIVVVVAFLLLQFPSSVYWVIKSFHLKHKASVIVTKKLLIFGNVVNVLLPISATLNFVWYSCFSTKFRITFKIFFVRRTASKGRPSESAIISTRSGVVCTHAKTQVCNPSINLPSQTRPHYETNDTYEMHPLTTDDGNTDFD